jgi:6-phosphofructokinase 1
MQGLVQPLGLPDVEHILPLGGTILRTSRTNPYREGGAEQVKRTLAKHGVEALIAIGGEDTLGGASRLSEDGLFVVGVPKTIDNDLSATDYTFGFDTAVHIATEAIDRLRTTAESHHRAAVVEVMGRNAGWIALHSGMAGGATVILVPEQPFDVDAVVEHCRRRFDSGYSPIVVVSEGAAPKGGELTLSGGETDAFGHVRLGGIGAALASLIEERTGREARAVVLGHVQRGGTPTPFDRVLATRFGLAAVDAVHDGQSGVMVALRGTDIVRVPLTAATAQLKLVPVERYAEAEVFFG